MWIELVNLRRTIKMYRIKRSTVVCYFLKLLPFIKENFNQRNLQGVPTGNPFNLLSASPPPFLLKQTQTNSSAKADELIVLSMFDHLAKLVLKGLMTNNISLDYNYLNCNQDKFYINSYYHYANILNKTGTFPNPFSTNVPLLYPLKT